MKIQNPYESVEGGTTLYARVYRRLQVSNIVGEDEHDVGLVPFMSPKPGTISTTASHRPTRVSSPSAHPHPGAQQASRAFLRGVPSIYSSARPELD